MPPLEHLLLFWPAWWSGSRVCVHGRVLPRNHEADIASGAVLLLRRRRPDINSTASCRRRDDQSMLSLGLSPLHAARTPRATHALGGHRGQTCVYLYSTVRWIHIMKPVRAHSVDPGECDRPPGQPARTRRRPPGYTQARNRECPGMTDLAVVSGQLGAKLAYRPNKTYSDGT